MDTSSLSISWTGLAWSSALVAIVIVVSTLMQLKLERRLLIGCVRTVVQLMVMGYVLGWIITVSDDRPLVVVAAVIFQIVMSCLTLRGLLDYRVPRWWLAAFLGVFPAYVVVMFLLVYAVIHPQPLWNARIVLTLGGMILGNTITAVALALNRFNSDINANRDLVLARLALGVTWRQAVIEERGAAAQAALLPMVTSLYTVGLVSLPGMMTGQIIAGADPVGAVKYQIIVMFMITAAVAVGASLTLAWMTRQALFLSPAGK